ncbi:MAG: hypothetical protein ABR568_22590, partial [Pyrinomonadaceae bacterium]
MLMRFVSNSSRYVFMVFVLAFSVCAMSTVGVSAQSVAQSSSGDGHGVASNSSKKTAESSPDNKKPNTTEEKLNTLEQMLETIAEQQETIRLLASKLNWGEASPEASMVRAEAEPQPAQSPAIEDRLKNVESRISELGSVKFSGDIRLRSESLFGLSNTLPSAGNPAVLGNELSPRHRMR